MKKTLGLIFSLLLVVSLFLSGCNNGQKKTIIEDSKQNETKSTEDSQEKVKTVKITFWDENPGPIQTPLYEELIKKFHEDVEGVEIEYLGIPYESAKQKYDVAIAANETPDVGGVHPSWLANFYSKNALYELDGYFEKWDEKDYMLDTVIGTVRKMTDDKLCLLPFTSNAPGIWYRVDWFNELGINEPKTWDEFFSAIEKLTDVENGRYGFSIRGGAGGSYQLLDAMYAYSGIDRIFDENGESTINDEKHIEFLTKYAAIYNKYTPESDVTNGYKEMVAAFDSGSAAMIQHNLGSQGEHSEALEEDQFSMMTFPKGVNGKYSLAAPNPGGVSIFKGTENVDAAWQFISYVCSEEGQSYWNMNVGQMPTNKKVLEHDWVKERKHIATSLEVFSNENTVLYDVPSYLPDYSRIMGDLAQPGWQAVLLGKETPKEFLDEWADALNEAQSDYMKDK